MADSALAEATLPADTTVFDACEAAACPDRESELAALPMLSVALVAEADATEAALLALA